MRLGGFIADSKSQISETVSGKTSFHLLKIFQKVCPSNFP